MFKKNHKQIIRLVLSLSVFLYLTLVGCLIYARAQRPEPDPHELDKRITVLEIKEQDRRDNSSLLWTLIGGNVLNVALTGFMIAITRK